MSPNKRKRVVDPYPDKIPGMFGELGSYSTSVRYLQSALPLNELDKLSLIAEIDGSERWGVRELFQRNVDRSRVRDDIVPYFKNQRKC